ncbi:MAG: glycosyltransferase [Verrucomicrobiales bacterium]
MGREREPHIHQINNLMRWLTCTPVSFSGGEDFFSRDSGLLSRGFRDLGVESTAVMPGPAQPGDLPELLRVPYSSLEDAGWWKACRADGVVLYAWGHPRYRKVAAAIRAAGIFLVLNQDSNGVVSPLNGPSLWLKDRWISSGAGRVAGGWLRFAWWILKGLTYGLARTDPMRRAHLNSGDVIAAVSPVAADYYKRLCRTYGGGELADRVAVVPHSVCEAFRVEKGGGRDDAILAIGRWKDERQKRTSLLMKVVERVLAAEPAVRFDIAGEPSEKLSAWHGCLAEDHKARTRLHGRLLPEQIAAIMRSTKTLYCPSAFESFHIASGEALCSGCSIVAADLPTLTSFPWFCGENCGRLAGEDSVSGHANALISELEAWRNGLRDPVRISGIWTLRLHSTRVAEKILSLAANQLPRDKKEIV